MAAAASASGASLIDAPVSGSTPQAEQGALRIFVGGEQRTCDACAPILQVLEHPVYLGPSGMGATMKLVVNTLLGLGGEALAEAVALGENAGLDRNRLLDVLGETSVVSPSQRTKIENVRRGDYSPAHRGRFESGGGLLRRREGDGALGGTRSGWERGVSLSD
jgi:3-hydroxyisobutyrate dehydrogenase-like beta-hydroxyacid dehydrogenase